mgnify:CR=1 FL=1
MKEALLGWFESMPAPLGVFLIASYNVREVLFRLEDRKEVVVYMRTGVAEEVANHQRGEAFMQGIEARNGE